jgi:enediyne biosynthesis protein E4
MMGNSTFIFQITLATQNVLSFGGGFFDYDNDGRLDLFIANGHVYPEVEQSAQKTAYKQINSLFHNDGKGRFVEVGSTSGDGFQTPYVGRGVAFADFDNDGFVDLVVGNNGDPPLLLHNGGGSGNHFVNFKLVGTKSNRDAMGARIRIRAGGISQIREIYGGGSYLSQSDLRANFGLGQATKIESVEVSWPSGSKQTFSNVEADKFYQVEEGKDDLVLQQFRHAPVAAPASQTPVAGQVSKPDAAR